MLKVNSHHLNIPNQFKMKLIFIALSLFSTLIVSAQTEINNWFVEASQAKEYALKNNVNVIMVFAGSDWCRPCIQFKKDILESESFQSYAQEGLAILYLDFPSKKKNMLSKELTTQNENLAEQYNKSGSFPKIMLLDSAMEKIKEVKFANQEPQAFIEQLKS